MADEQWKAPAATLVHSESGAGAREYVLRDEAYTIGRSPECDIVIQQRMISRVHARIERRGSRYVLIDMQSANGTYVNGQRLLHPQLLTDNDQIGLGAAGAILRFLDPDPTVPAAGYIRYDEQLLAFLIGGVQLDLTPIQFRLLRYLYEHAGQVCLRAECARAIWGHEYNADTDALALEQHVAGLRARLRAADATRQFIETRRAVGYRLIL